jgi:hypothetical protein
MGERLTELVKFTVACARLGRTLASIGAYLTSAEQEQISEIYSRLSNREIIDKGSPTIALITSKQGRKSKIPQTVAINWFIDNYPRWSTPLQKKLKESRPPRTKTMLAYGLGEGEDLDDEYYVSVIRDVANLSEQQAETLYREIISPSLDMLEELSGLTETEIKK